MFKFNHCIELKNYFKKRNIFLNFFKILFLISYKFSREQKLRYYFEI